MPAVIAARQERDSPKRVFRSDGGVLNNFFWREGEIMTTSEIFEGLESMRLSRRGQKVGMDSQSFEYFMASGLGSRGGPNKVTNKLRSSPKSYVPDNTLEFLMASALRSRGGANKITNKMKRSLASYLYYN
jgi:hypothetical protein